MRPRRPALFGCAPSRRWSSAATEFERALPRIVSVVEEPIAASSIVPMYFVCERARQDVKVALVGQGPDELFGGYTRHLGVQLRRRTGAACPPGCGGASRPASPGCRATRR